MTRLGIGQHPRSVTRRVWSELTSQIYLINYQIVSLFLVAFGLSELTMLIALLVNKSSLNPFKVISEAYIDTFKSVFEGQVVCAQQEREKLWKFTEWHLRTSSYYYTWRMLVQILLSVLRLILIAVLVINLPTLVSVAGSQLADHGRSLSLDYRETIDKVRSLFLLTLLVWTVPHIVLMRIVARSKTSMRGSNTSMRWLPPSPFDPSWILTPARIALRILKRCQLLLILLYITLWTGLLVQLTLGSLLPGGGDWLITISSVLMLIFLFIVIEGAIRMLSALITRTKIMRSTDSTIAVILLSLLGMLGLPVSVLRKSTTRRSLIGIIEGLAIQFELFLPAQILGANYRESTLYPEFCGIANGIRRTKIQIANPKSGLWSERLRHDLSSVFSSFILLRWEDLPRGDTQPRSKASLMRQFREVLKAAATGAIPGVALLLYQKTPLGLSGQLLELTTLAVIGWFIISVLLRLDPEFSAKAKAIKEAKDIIKG